MGDARFDRPLARIRQARDRLGAIERMRYEELVLALGAASRDRDPYLANVLTTELLNRSRRGRALVLSLGLGISAGVVLFFAAAALLSGHPHNFSDHVFLLLAFVALAFAALGAALFHAPVRRALMRRRA